MALRVAIVEDEEKARDTLKQYLERFGSENGVTFLIDSYPSPVMLLEKYQAEYQILFMDIQMPDINGMDAARRIRAMDGSVVLIFVTSLTQYAIAGYEVEALDYIVKPVQYYSFALKLTKALRHVNADAEDAISVSTGFGTARIHLRDIRYIEVRDHLLTYYTFDGSFSEFQTISNVEKAVNGKDFARVSNACLVNLRCVKGYKGYTVFLLDDTELRISQPRKKAFVRTLEQFREKGNNPAPSAAPDA